MRNQVYADLMPHGACWRWDPRLILLHAPADLGTFLCYMVIPVLVLYVYRRGRMHAIREAYPRLWTSGAAFVFFCGLSHLGGFLEVWWGGWVYLATGVNKLLMLAASIRFVWYLWKRREDIVDLGQIVGRLVELSKTAVSCLPPQSS